MTHEFLEYEQKQQTRRQHEEAKQQYIKGIIKMVNTYINEVLAKTDEYKGVDIGLVYTRLEDDLRNNEFMIWISRSNGLTINHKFIKLSDIGLVYDFKEAKANQ